MRNTIQIIGAVIATIIACIGYGLSVYYGVKQKLSTWQMFEKLTFTSAVTIIVLIIFVCISLLF